MTEMRLFKIGRRSPAFHDSLIDATSLDLAELLEQMRVLVSPLV